MKTVNYDNLAENSIKELPLDKETALSILTSKDIELISLINATFKVRKEYFGKTISIHIINNIQNGYCPEDCKYCAQSKDSSADIDQYTMKSDEDIVKEAKAAYEKGAFRYCMVSSGITPNPDRIEHIANVIRKIKSLYNIEVCISAGILDKEKLSILKDAGADRINHNINTSESLYPNICTTHKYSDRLRTISLAKEIGLQVCSGIIIGMGETAEDIIEMALTLNKMRVESIPVNFFIPIEGTRIKYISLLDPEYCLRVLCLFRLLNPKADIRIAAGRELHLREMEVLSFYIANSLFLDGYLNTKGSKNNKTYQMIIDAGFTLNSDFSLDELIKDEPQFLKDHSEEFSNTIKK
ncbi:MAG: biotin synthase BioB [Candidatus Omnitrophica bacterium]|nr:biotin synthase BioB [Candidatus Omnitrophota bacterium]MBU1997082.1 biotin synthase BioB [Candidatus Omnitrophota bacterium]MBU4333394.1 biotin synthase BioB [Candidatus Omnitrophota bacterium]